MSKQIYVNAPLDPEDYDALKVRAHEKGRNLGRELAQIAKRALRRSGHTPKEVLK